MPPFAALAGSLKARGLIALLAGLALVALTCAGPAGASSLLKPPGKKIWWGVSDTGDPADFGQFSDVLNKHPAVIQSFRTWGSDFDESIRRWQIAQARPMIHLSTEDNNTGGELITPAQIATGAGDAYLVRLNHLFANKKMRAYVRPLGEPNRCLNAWAAYDCAGASRGPEHSPRNYKRAFRRIYVIVHGGGKARQLNRRLAKAGLPPLTVNIGGLPKAPVAVIWSPLPAGSPTVPHNRPRHFYPGRRWVDWAGTDFYAGYPDWKSLTGLYRRFSGKPFAITEWALENGDDPTFVRRLFAWVRSHPRTRMLVYYQDFGAASSYRIQNYSTSLSVLRARLHSGLFPAYARGAPKLPPPPPGGVGAR
ncbi:MAG TPA: hypothetical protein VFM51_11250 [Solirubrobacterales bacterium]|nr:hypothetical protein [Solirubrobacterales bacterium]